MNDLVKVKNEKVENMIYEIRGKQVMVSRRFLFSINKGKNIKYLPHVFTEQGVAMLASVLHKDIAI